MADLSLRSVCALRVLGSASCAWGDSRVANVGGATLGMHLFRIRSGSSGVSWRVGFLRGNNKMNLKASVTLQPASGHPLLAPSVSTHASATQVSLPCEGGAGGDDSRSDTANVFPQMGTTRRRKAGQNPLGRPCSRLRRAPPEPPLRKVGKFFAP